MNLIEHFINGKITKGSSKKTSKVFNPATGEQTAEVNLASKADVDLAVEKANKAFTDWSRKPPAQRARVIFKFKELIEKNLEFEEIDVSKTPEKWKEVEKLSGGDRITPVLVNPDGSVEIGFRGIGCNYNS